MILFTQNSLQISKVPSVKQGVLLSSIPNKSYCCREIFHKFKKKVWKKKNALKHLQAQPGL